MVEKIKVITSLSESIGRAEEFLEVSEPTLGCIEADIVPDHSIKWTREGFLRQSLSECLGSPTPVIIGIGGDLLYRMNPSTMTASRGAGTIYVRSSGPLWRAYSNPTTVPVIGEAVGPTKNVGGYTLRYPYPEWRVGHTPAAGDVFWHNGPAGDTRLVVCVAGGNVMPEAWGLVRPDRQGAQVDDSAGNTWRADVEYEPEYGVYLEPETTQLVSEPASINTSNGWNNVNGNSDYIGLADGIIQNYAGNDWSYTGSSDLASLTAPNLVAVTQGTTYTLHGLFKRLGKGTSIRISDNTASPDMQFEVDVTTGIPTVTGAAPGNYRFRLFRDGIVDMSMTFTASTSRNVRPVIWISRTASTHGQTAWRCYYLGAMQTSDRREPIPEQTTRPADTFCNYASNVDAWVAPGMQTEGQVLVAVQRHRDRESGDSSDIHITTSRGSTVIYATGTTAGSVTYNSSDGTENVNAIVNGKEHFVSADWAGTIRNVNANEVGQAVISTSGTHDGDFALDEEFVRARRQAAGFTLRALAWWKVNNAFDHDTEFGPDNYTNYPLPSLTPPVISNLIIYPHPTGIGFEFDTDEPCTSVIKHNGITRDELTTQDHTHHVLSIDGLSQSQSVSWALEVTSAVSALTVTRTGTTVTDAQEAFPNGYELVNYDPDKPRWKRIGPRDWYYLNEDTATTNPRIDIKPDEPMAMGKEYRVVFDLTEFTGPAEKQLRLRMGSNTTDVDVVTDNGEYDNILTPNNTQNGDFRMLIVDNTNVDTLRLADLHIDYQPVPPVDLVITPNATTDNYFTKTGDGVGTLQVTGVTTDVDGLLEYRWRLSGETWSDWANSDSDTPSQSHSFPSLGDVACTGVESYDFEFRGRLPAYDGDANQYDVLTPDFVDAATEIDPAQTLWEIQTNHPTTSREFTVMPPIGSSPGDPVVLVVQTGHNDQPTDYPPNLDLVAYNNPEGAGVSILAGVVPPSGGWDFNHQYLIPYHCVVLSNRTASNAQAITPWTEYQAAVGRVYHDGGTMPARGMPLMFWSSVRNAMQGTETNHFATWDNFDQDDVELVRFHNWLSGNVNEPSVGNISSPSLNVSYLKQVLDPGTDLGQIHFHQSQNRMVGWFTFVWE